MILYLYFCNLTFDYVLMLYVMQCEWSLRPVYSDTTQLNSTSSWVELRRCRHPHQRNSTFADDRQCNWLSWSVQPISAKQVNWVELRRRRYRHFADATQLNWTQLDVELSWVELRRYKWAFNGLYMSPCVCVVATFLRHSTSNNGVPLKSRDWNIVVCTDCT